MAGRIRLLVGTKKGLFLLEADAATRAAWSLSGPFCDAWPIMHAVDVDGTMLAGGGNEWFGPAVWRSADGGATWSHHGAGLTYGEGEPPVRAVWSLARGPGEGAGGVLWAGVEPAGLFRSTDGGLSWEHVAGLRAHPSRPHWVPGFGGLILHSLVPHPEDPRQLWVGISSVGVFHTADGGATWQPRNSGTRCDFLPEDQRYPEYGQCVHCLVMAPGMPNRLYQQNHCGMYRSEDGGRSWQSIEQGLPSSFGFPAAVHPRDPDQLFLLPLNGDTLGRFVPEGKAAVWRTRDSGRGWQALRHGLPQGGAYFGVLRQAMATDPLTPAGVYFGTGSGAVFASADEGESWRCIAEHLPTISSVEVQVVPA